MRRELAQTLMALIEAYVSIEIAWHVLHDGDEMLWEVGRDKLTEQWAEMRYKIEVLDTLRMIRRLPE